MKKKNRLKKVKEKKTNEKNRLRLKKTEFFKKTDVKSVGYLNIGGYKVKTSTIKKEDGTEGFFLHTNGDVRIEIRIVIKNIQCTSVKYLYDQFINETTNKEAIDEEIKKLVEQGQIIVDEDGTITRLIDERWKEWVD